MFDFCHLVITGFETNNRYDILNGDNQQIYFALEGKPNWTHICLKCIELQIIIALSIQESSTGQRLLAGPKRAFEIHFKNADGADCFVISRPLNLLDGYGLLFP